MEIEGNVTLTVKELDRFKKNLEEITKERDELLSHEKSIKLDITIGGNRFEDSIPYLAEYRDNKDKYGRIISKEVIGVKEVKVKKVEFINLDNIISLLEEDAREKVHQEIEDKNSTINSKIQEITRIRDSNEKHLIKQQEVFNKKEQELIKENNSLENKIKELQGIEIEKGKDERIQKLEESLKKLSLELIIEKEKKWYQKF